MPEHEKNTLTILNEDGTQSQYVVKAEPHNVSSYFAGQEPPRRKGGLLALACGLCLIVGASLTTIAKYEGAAVAPSHTAGPVALAQVTNQIFSDQEVRLDGQAFHNCTFRNVTMIYNGGPYELDGSTFSGTLRFGTYSVPVSNSMNLLRELGAYQESFGKAMSYTTPKVLRGAGP